MHCRFPEHHRGGGSGAAIVLVLIVAIALIARPVEHAARAAEHTAIDVAEYLLIGILAAAGLALAGCIAYLVREARRTHAQRTLSAMQNHAKAIPAMVILDAAEAVSAPQPLAIDTPAPTLADVEDLAAAHGYQLVAKRQTVRPGVIPLEIDPE